MADEGLTTVKKYSFKLLKDEVELKDLFEDQTHDNIAESLKDLIINESGGITVGLEGSWGSGKSMVISLLKNKFAVNKNIKIIQFDAWAHQGDPLRRIFLESLIDDISNGSSITFENLKNKISKRTKTTRIKTKRSVTSLGRFISITTFFIPVGLALMTLVKNLTFSWGGTPNYFFIFSILFTASPLLVLGCNLLKLLNFKRKNKTVKIWDSKYWAFLQEDSTKDLTQEISEDEERSSIEFERYFTQIIELFFQDNDKDSRLVIVIDNLDRVNSKDALTVWSTLQTFLQQRSSIKKKEWFNKIWIIVPYDPDGLASLWAKDDRPYQNFNLPGFEANDSRPIANNDVVKAFMDKNFQIRFEVPRQILSGWESYTYKLMNVALIGWNKNEINEAVRVLRSTRENITDIPTPRELKNFINHLAVLVYVNNGNVPIKSIAYYIILRYMKGLSRYHLRNNLISGNLPNENIIEFLPETIRKDLVGLLFGVSPEKGYELLLEPIISEGLSNNKIKELKALIESHGVSFWPVFYYHIENAPLKFQDMLNYAITITGIIDHDNYSMMSEFVSKINGIISSQKINFNFSDKKETEAFIAIIKLCHTNGKSDIVVNCYNKTLINFEKHLEENATLDNQSIIFFNTIIKNIIEYGIPIQCQEINFSKLNNFLTWSKLSFENLTNLWQWVLPDTILMKEIGGKIQPGVLISDGILEAIKYLSNAKVNIDWDPILMQCKAHIEYNAANYNNHSMSVYEIITVIGLSFPTTYQTVRSILTNGHFFHLFNQRSTEVLLEVSILSAVIFKSELNTCTIRVHGSSNAGIEKIRDFWKTPDENNAINAIQYLKTFNQLSVLWELAKDSQNKNVAKIIELMIQDENESGFFHIEDGLDTIYNYDNLLSEFDPLKMQALANKLITNSNIENELIHADNLDVEKYCTDLKFLIPPSKDNEFLNKIFDVIKEYNKEIWVRSLKEDNYLTSLAIELRNKDEKYSLTHNYLDALTDFTLTTDGISDWQKSHWNELTNLLEKEYKREYITKLSEHFIRSRGEMSKLLYEISCNYIDREKVLKYGSFYETVVEDFIKNDDYDKLKMFNDSFNSEDIKNYYTIDQDKNKIIADRIRDKFDKVTEDQRDILTNIMERLNIRI